MPAVPRLHVPSKLIWSALWLGLAATLFGIGSAIAIALDSTLLGFIGADLIFVVATSIYMSGPVESNCVKH